MNPDDAKVPPSGSSGALNWIRVFVYVFVGLRDHLYARELSKREKAAAVLRNTDSPAVAKQLIAVFDDPSRYVATRAAFGLSLMKSVLVVPFLEEALRGDSDVRSELAAWALGRINTVKARESLVSALEDPRKHVRYRAAGGLWPHALRGYKSDRAERLLAGMLKGDNGQAAITLQRMRGPRYVFKDRRRYSSVFQRMGGNWIR